ncbi:MAG TPA: hypothetical protein DCF71_00550 [Gemmatimonadetes bacterium]|nr:hypothetical protein [Gemmatimonadota bacterium]
MVGSVCSSGASTEITGMDGRLNSPGSAGSSMSSMRTTSMISSAGIDQLTALISGKSSDSSTCSAAASTNETASMPSKRCFRRSFAVNTGITCVVTGAPPFETWCPEPVVSCRWQGLCQTARSRPRAAFRAPLPLAVYRG